MQLGMVGLGRMGGNMAERLRRDGHDVETYDPHVDSTASSLAALVQQLEAPRALWMMVPAGPITEETFRELQRVLQAGDTVVDGGNSNFRDSLRRHAEARANEIHFVDAGVSGGVWGLDNGYCLMVGGDPEPVRRLEPVFLSLAPENGYLHTGPSGSGHFTKMVHNGIEYGMMQAYAEGFEILKESQWELDLGAIAEVWRHGSVVRAWLLDLLALAFEQEGNDLSKVRGYVQDSGEGRWTVIEAINESVPAPAITASLFARFASRQDESFAAQVNAALRNQFGGHAVKRE